MRVQNPLSALYSDMLGYHQRAIDVLDGVTRGDPRVYAFFPWGAHVLTAAELGLVGRTNMIGVAVIHSLLGTIPAMCVVYLTGRVVKSRWVLLAAGFAAAVWQPSVVHSGFFMSELWFSLFLLPATVYTLRFLEGKGGAFRAGFCLAIATVVRPQVLLTAAIVGGLVVAGWLARMLVSSLRPKVTVRSFARFALPLVLILGFSAYRFHKFTNHWGIVSENAAINRVFGATHLGRIESIWSYGGGRYSAWYTPPAKSPVKPRDRIKFEGYIGEEAILDRIREDHYARENTEQHIRRMHRNTKMLTYRFIFPEDDFAANGAHPYRAWLQRTFRWILINILPIGVFGLLAMLVQKRHRLLGVLILAHGVTLIVVAALYFAEARMRMPYDPFLLTAVTVGGVTVFRLLGKLQSLVRERRFPI